MKIKHLLAIVVVMSAVACSGGQQSTDVAQNQIVTAESPQSSATGTKHLSFTPEGVCSSKMDVTINGDIVEEVLFTGGCNGNGKGIAALVKGMTVTEAIERLEGITCGSKPTSCPDQLSHALRQIAE